MNDNMTLRELLKLKTDTEEDISHLVEKLYAKIGVPIVEIEVTPEAVDSLEWRTNIEMIIPGDYKFDYDNDLNERRENNEN